MSMDSITFSHKLWRHSIKHSALRKRFRARGAASQTRLYFLLKPRERHSTARRTTPSTPHSPRPSPFSATSMAASRVREKPTGDEEASSVLVLGEFDGVPSLSLSEARLLINVVMETRRRTTNRKVEETETLVKTQDYLDVFARFKQKENIEAVERLLSGQTGFEPFERSQLGGLMLLLASRRRAFVGMG